MVRERESDRCSGDSGAEDLAPSVVLVSGIIVEITRLMSLVKCGEDGKSGKVL